MILKNYASFWEIDHCIRIPSFNLLDENKMKKCFSWKILRPMYCNENFAKKDEKLFIADTIPDAGN